MTKAGKKNLIVILGLMVVAVLMVVFKYVFMGPKTHEELIREHPNFPKVSKVIIEPYEPLSSQYIQVTPQLEQGNPEYVTYQYRWYVNDTAVEGDAGSQQILESKNFKKGDKVFCKVIAVRSEMVAEEVASDTVVVLNSAPQIFKTPMAPFTIPTEITYKIKAEDVDGDELTYTLISPLDRGITINPGDGTIHWKIKEKPEDFNKNNDISLGDLMGSGKKKPVVNHSPDVSIQFEVKDSDGAVARGALDLNLLLGEESKS